MTSFKTMYGHLGMALGSTNGHGLHTGNHCLIQVGRLFLCISTDVYHSYLLNKVHWDKGQYMIN